MDLPTWSSILRDFGYPAVIFAGTVVAWWRLAVWGKPHVEGLIADHRALVQQTTKSVLAMEVANARTQSELQKLTELLRVLVTTSDSTEKLLVAHDERARRSVDNFEARLNQMERSRA